MVPPTHDAAPQPDVSPSTSSELYGDKLEQIVAGAVGYLQQVLSTFKLLCFRPHRAPFLISDQNARTFSPPLGFLVSGYFAATIVASFNKDAGARSQLSTNIRGVFFESLNRQLSTLTASPVQVILLALPLVFLLIILASLGAAILRTDRHLVVAVCAYPTGFIWWFLTLGLVAFDIAILLRRSLPELDPIDYALFALAGVALLWGFVAWIIQILTLASAGAKNRRAAAAVATIIGLILVTITSTIAEAHFLSATFIEPLRYTPLDLDFEVRGIQFSNDDYVTVNNYNEKGFYRDVQAVDTLPGMAWAESKPLTLLLVLRNRSDSTLLIPRFPMRSGANTLEIGLAEERGHVVHLTCRRMTNLAILDWSDRNDPVLVLRKGDVKWIRLTGQLAGYSSIGELNGFKLKVNLRGVEAFLETPWQTVFQEMPRDWSTEPATESDDVILPRCRDADRTSQTITDTFPP